MATDRFVLEDRVVDGPHWSAWRATDTVLHRDVGVVVVAADHPRREAVATAARAAACITDPGLLHVYDVKDAPDGGVRIVREWTAGVTLVERLADGPMDPDQACLLGIQVARTLAVAHAGGVTHGALGPGDVLITDDGRARVAGLATRALLEHGPELGDGDGAAVPPSSSDAWAAAAVTYAAVTGRWPDQARDGLPGAGRLGSVPRPRQVRAGVPKALDQALAAALAEPPDDPGTVAESLEAVLVTVGRRATDSGEPPTGTRDGQRRRHAAAKRAGVLLAVAALAGAAWVGFHLAQDSTGGSAEPGPSTSGSPGPAVSPSPTGSAGDATGRVPVVLGTDFDPSGNGSENPDLVALAFDDNLATAWRTVSYAQADLAPKSGVGVVFDLGAVETVGAVRLNLVGAGTTLEVRTSQSLGERRKDFTLFGDGTNVGDLFTLRSPTPVQARYVLVWLTGLPADGETYRGGIVEIVVARS